MKTVFGRIESAYVHIILSQLLFSSGFLSGCKSEISLPSHEMNFEKLSQTWDEAIPLGNGSLGALIWEKEGKLRFSLDKSDLWDMRPMEIKNRENWKYQWIKEQLEKGTYENVHNSLDRLYGENPAPTKIPGGAIEFDVSELGKVEEVKLTIVDATCKIKWQNGVELNTFVHATKDVGWFRFVGVDPSFTPIIIAPAYNKGDTLREANSLNTQDLVTLGYEQGKIEARDNYQRYIQEGWGGFKYHVEVEWDYEEGVLDGSWSISTYYPKWEKSIQADQLSSESLLNGFASERKEHISWWHAYWKKSGIQLPDKILENQWYMDTYKFGSTARSNTPPISLQAVWTADNGRIPPWKGDYHNDLNVQLSYWPAYSGNHLDLEEGLINWLWSCRENFKEFTKEFFESEGLNVPGATSIDGTGMGGWSQYGYTPTASAWLGHHFYLHWRYTMDREFLEEKAYPWIKDVAIYLEDISVTDGNNKLKLPLSSSPEIYDNKPEAWFSNLTNYDLALIRFTYEKAAELALELDKTEEAIRWNDLLQSYPDYAVDDETGLMFAPGYPYNESHRHMSHLMAIHPLGLLDRSKSISHQKLIETSLDNLEKQGTSLWVGYSFTWVANLYARNGDGDKAVEYLDIFAKNFCLSNTFHANGEQHDRGYSNWKYRPFTLEGNFAFAAAIQEMLLQSHTGVVRIFPAVPDNWMNLSFDNLRTEGAFLISAEKRDGVITEVIIKAEQDGILKISNPYDHGKSDKLVNEEIRSIKMLAGESLSLSREWFQ